MHTVWMHAAAVALLALLARGKYMYKLLVYSVVQSSFTTLLIYFSHRGLANLQMRHELLARNRQLADRMQQNDGIVPRGWHVRAFSHPEWERLCQAQLVLSFGGPRQVVRHEEPVSRAAWGQGGIPVLLQLQHVQRGPEHHVGS